MSPYEPTPLQQLCGSWCLYCSALLIYRGAIITLLISDLVNYAAIIFMTFKASLKIRCMKRPVICSVRRASTLLLRLNHSSHRFLRRYKAFDTRWGSLPLRLWSSLSRRNRKYRNTKQTKANRWRHNNPLELSWWSGPVGTYNNPHHSQHYCSSRNGLMVKGTPFSLHYTSVPTIWGNQKTDPDIKWPRRHMFGCASDKGPTMGEPRR